MSTNNTNDRKNYYAARNKKNITFKVDSLEMKDRIRAAAEKDNRSIQSYFNQYVLPLLYDLVDKHLGPEPKKKR